MHFLLKPWEMVVVVVVKRDEVEDTRHVIPSQVEIMIISQTGNNVGCTRVCMRKASSSGKKGDKHQDNLFEKTLALENTRV